MLTSSSAGQAGQDHATRDRPNGHGSLHSSLLDMGLINTAQSFERELLETEKLKILKNLVADGNWTDVCSCLSSLKVLVAYAVLHTI